MGNFVTGNVTLPPYKIDATPPQGNPAELDAGDINFLRDAVGDLRTHTQGVVNVKSYGAVGDGTTDDSTAFAAAIAAVTTSGGTVYVPPATYALASAVTLPDKVSLIGPSRRAAVLLFTGATSGVVFPAGAERFSLENLTISTSNAGALKAIDMSAGSTAGAGYGFFSIKSVRIAATGSGRWATGLDARFAEVAEVIGLSIFQSATIGVYLADSCNQLSFYDLEITGGGSADTTYNRGIWIDANPSGTGAPEFFGCTSQGRWALGAAVYISGHHPKFYGLHAEGTGAAADGGDFVVNGTTEVSIFGAHIVQALVVTGTVRGFLADGLDACGAVTFASTVQGAFVVNSRVASITDSGAVASATDNGNGWINCRLTNGTMLRNKGIVEFDAAGAVSASNAAQPANAAMSFANGTLLYWRQADGTTHRGVVQLTGSDQVIFEYPATKQITFRNGTPSIKATITDTKFTSLVGFAFTRVVTTYGTTIAIDASLGNEFVTTPTDGVAFQLNNPSNATAGQRITIRVRNTFGVLGALTFGTLYKAAAWTQPANGFSRAIDFQYDGTNWIEVSRTPADVPN